VALNLPDIDVKKVTVESLTCGVCFVKADLQGQKSNDRHADKCTV